VHNFTRKCQSTRARISCCIFILPLQYQCKSLRHVTHCTQQWHFKHVYIDQIHRSQNKTPESQTFKIYVHNVQHSHEHMCSNDCATVSNRCCDDGVVQQSADIFLIMDPQTVDPLLKDIPDALVQQIQIRRIVLPHLWGMNSLFILQHCDNVT